MNLKIKLIVTFIFIGICSTVTSFSQNYSIKGFLYDANNGEPLAFATVKIKSSSQGARSNVSGFFSIPNLTDSNLNLVILNFGYEEIDTTITMTQNITNLKFYLTKKNHVTNTVIVQAKKSDKTNQVNIGITKISSKDIEKIPSIGGEPDIAQYLQLTPGVVFTGDQGGELFIRGGSPVQYKLLLDGMTIYNPFHSIGLFSVFETDLIRNADIITGGFHAEYGDRTSSIIDITTKDGNKKQLSGKFSISPIMGRIMFEGPLSKPKQQNGLSTTTFVLSIKKSIIDRTSKSIYSGLVNINKEEGLPYTFSDLYGKISFNDEGGSKINIFGFNFNDENQFANTASYKWNSYGGGTNFIISPISSNIFVDGKINFSSYKITSTEADRKPRESAINGFEAGLNFSNYYSNFSELKYGFELLGFQTDYKFVNYNNINLSQQQYTTQAATFIRYRKNFNDNIIFEPSFRLMYYASLSAASPEPRLGIKWNVKNNIRLKAATGLYSQNLISTKSDIDVVNYFTGFISGPEENLNDLNGNIAKNNIQKAFHFITGVEFDIEKLEIQIEPWYKDFNQIININRNKISVTDKEYNIEKGSAKGIDFTAKYTKNKIFAQLICGYQELLRFYNNNGTIQSYPPPYDRRFNLNIVTTYSSKNKNNWDLSFRFNFGSALPFTLTQAFNQNYNFNYLGSATDILSQNGTLGIIYDNNINSGRLSDYHRLDLSAQKNITMKKTNDLIQINFSLTNAMNRQNIFYINRITNSKIYQLPILPSLTLVYKLQ